MAYLELNNITKKYEELIALDNFNFSVEKNEFSVLFGSSAAGKTTTLRCIAGLEQIQSGEVFFNDKTGVSYHYWINGKSLPQSKMERLILSQR